MVSNFFYIPLLMLITVFPTNAKNSVPEPLPTTRVVFVNIPPKQELPPKLVVQPIQTPSPEIVQEVIPDRIIERERPYDFSEFEVTEEELSPFLRGPFPPSQIVFRDENNTKSISTKQSTSQNTLNIASESFARKIAEERAKQAAERSASVPPAPPAPPPGPGGGTPSTPVRTQLGSGEYSLYSFHPGLRDDRVTAITPPRNIFQSILGPDFSMENIDQNDRAALEEARTHVVSLGHGGEIILKVNGDGAIMNETGADFAVFENVFRFGQGRIYQEYARVGVSETGNEADFKWFPCNPPESQLQGCAGIVPTDEGGDAFDLGELGVNRARFIKLKDIGTNFNLGRNTEGFDLDAVRLLHAY